MKLSNSPAITQHREVPVPRRQDVDERPCVPRLELDHFESQPDSPRINQRFLIDYILAPGWRIRLSTGAQKKLSLRALLRLWISILLGAACLVPVYPPGACHNIP